MTLATIRSHLWRGGTDILLYYKPNGRRGIRHFPPPPQQASNIPVSVPPTLPTAIPPNAS